MESKFYLCTTCGNVIMKAVDSGVTPHCCGHEMVELVAKTTDMASEKHVPVATITGRDTIRVEVGSVIHPMTEKHHICFIYLETTCGGQIHWLKADDTPAATFCCRKEQFIAAYEYCNLHGWWKSTVLNDAPACSPDSGKPRCCSTGKTLTAMLCVLLGLGACRAQAQQPIDNTPVNRLDLNRYLGKWYEIARYDHGFEKGMTNTTAMYSLNDNGTVKVVNSGWKNGKPKISNGVAKRPDAVKTPGLMRVSFFRPFYGDYRILMLDPDYTYALVGSKGDKYLWLLARTPKPDKEQVDLMVKEAERRGYDTKRLLWIDQSRNE